MERRFRFLGPDEKFEGKDLGLAFGPLDPSTEKEAREVEYYREQKRQQEIEESETE